VQAQDYAVIYASVKEISDKNRSTTMRFMGRIRPLVLAALLALARAAAAQEPAQPERGEQMLNAACLTCPDHRHVDTQALDEPGWTKVVKAEGARGAKVKTDDVPVLVDYLVRNVMNCR